MSDGAATYAFVLDGQGNPAATSAQTIQTAKQDARSPLGAAILLSCHHAFIQDFNALSDDERAESGLAPDACSDPDALLDLPARAPHSALVGNVHLYLVQILRYAAAAAGRLDRAVHPALGVLGFSTGMLAAAVVACADGVPALVAHATEAFRLAFWLGLRAQQYARRALRGVGLPDPEAQPWTLVVLGAARDAVQGAVDRYNACKDPAIRVHLTAVTNDKCASVSGRPDALAVFRRDHLPPGTTQSRFASIYTLYHAPELRDVKEQVMRDLAAHNVQFPAYASLRHTLRSPVDGARIQATDESTLAEHVVDATLLHPADFDTLAARVRASLGPSDNVNLVNLGPGTVLWRSTARALPAARLTLLDWSVPPTPAPTAGPAPPPAPEREPIAIVGMAVRFPGAPDAAGLWRVLEQGLNTVSEIPATRFDVRAYTAGAHGAGRTLRTTLGNFIDDADVFDNAFFGVSPREARAMDPQQRLLLHVAHHALEDAGYVPGATPSFAPDTFGTYVGAATHDYVQNLRHDVDVHYSTGTLGAFLSGRLAYAFQLGGPSVVVDTACSSSLVALHHAVRALQAGDCAAALAGGVNVITSPDMYIGLDRAHFLSAHHNCTPWDAAADGYCRAEGAGVFVLKRLRDALAEGDRVHGVVHASGVNQSVHAGSITRPHGPAQVALFRRVLAEARVRPGEVGVVEAHGTGTPAGDPVELASIRAVFAQQQRDRAAPLRVTASKACIGHAEAAAGAAGLAALLLMLRHAAVPRGGALHRLSPRIPPLGDGVAIAAERAPWPAPRVALLNSFGAAGSNAALVLGEAAPPPACPPRELRAVVLGIACESEAALEAQRAAYILHLQGAVDLRDAAYTATARRRAYGVRLAAAGRTRAEVVAALRAAPVVRVGARRGAVVLVFSGQGGAYAGMGRALYAGVPGFRARVDACEEMLVGWGCPGVRGVIEGGEEEGGVGARQAAVFVLECALAEMWARWGVRPDAVVGHSLGEYAALVAAGVLSLEDGLWIVAGRAGLMAEKCVREATGMLAVRMSPVELESHLEANAGYDQLSVACHNSCADGVVAGALAQLDALQAELKAAGRKCAKVDVPFGYHSPAMEPILDDLTALAARVQLNPPTIPVVSNVHGTVVAPGDASVFTADYFARHCREPVRFEQGIHALLAHALPDVGVWLELGPHPTTLPMLRAIPATSAQALYLPSLKKGADDWGVVCGALAALYCTAAAVDWRAVFADLSPDARVVDLPAYPFAKTRFWVKYEENAPAPAPPVSTRFELLETVLHMPSAGAAEPARFETPIARLAPLIAGHQVAGHALCPASVYIEMASAAAVLVFEHHGRMDGDGVVALADIAFSHPLVYSPDVARTVCVEVALAAPGETHAAAFTVSSYAGPTTAQAHCTGTLALASKARTAAKFATSATALERRHRAVSESRRAETFHTRTAYDLVFARVVAYGAAYRTIRAIALDPNGVDAAAVAQLPPDTVPGAFVAHPVFVDTLLHAVGLVVNCAAAPGDAFVCARVDKVKVLPALIRADARYGVCCSIGLLTDAEAVGDAWAFEMGTAPVRVVAVMKRMQFKKVGLGAFAAVLKAAATRADGRRASGEAEVEKVAVARPRTPAPLVVASSSVAARVKEIIANVLGVPTQDLADEQDLERLGLDSLASIEAHHALASALGTPVPDDIFATCKTVSGLVSVLDPHPTSHAVPASPAPSSPHGSESTLNDGPNPDLARAATLVKVRGVLASVLGVPVSDLRDDADLERMGMDSLMSIEAQHALATALDADLPPDLFGTCKTIREVHDLVAPPSSPPSPKKGGSSGCVVVPSFGTDENPVLLQDGHGSTKPPLFLIHDGSGVAHQYGRLSSLGRRVWGIHNPRFPEGGKWDGGLPEMAEHYALLVKKTLGTASQCILGGWSIGGVIAFEVSRRLIASGVDVPGLVLIDCPHPGTTTPLSKDVLDAAFARSSPGRGVELARACIEHATAALVQYDPWASPVRHAAPRKAVMLRCREPFGGENDAGMGAQSSSFLADRLDPGTVTAGWEAVLGFRVPVLDVPGNHFEPFSPRYVGEVSERLSEALNLLL